MKRFLCWWLGHSWVIPDGAFERYVRNKSTQKDVVVCDRCGQR